jgi:hypothetical protein
MSLATKKFDTTDGRHCALQLELARLISNLMARSRFCRMTAIDPLVIRGCDRSAAASKVQRSLVLSRRPPALGHGRRWSDIELKLQSAPWLTTPQSSPVQWRLRSLGLPFAPNLPE